MRRAQEASVTGSVPVCKEILHLADDGVKTVSMELGNHGPVIVFPRRRSRAGRRRGHRDPGQPMDAVVLIGGCDKTVPAQLMGAASADLPAIRIVAGPMMTSKYGEERLGACTDCRRYWATGPSARRVR